MSNKQSQQSRDKQANEAHGPSNLALLVATVVVLPSLWVGLSAANSVHSATGSRVLSLLTFPVVGFVLIGVLGYVAELIGGYA